MKLRVLGLPRTNWLVPSRERQNLNTFGNDLRNFWFHLRRGADYTVYTESVIFIKLDVIHSHGSCEFDSCLCNVCIHDRNFQEVQELL
jgi:hypothetical protein